MCVKSLIKTTCIKYVIKKKYIIILIGVFKYKNLTKNNYLKKNSFFLNTSSRSAKKIESIIAYTTGYHRAETYFIQICV